MELYSYRHLLTDKSTISDLFVGSEYECHIMEDFDRELDSRMSLSVIKATKEYGVTAIPYGRYRIVIDRSPKMSQKESKKAGEPVDIFTPHLLDVPAFEGIRIHVANWPHEIEGCLAPGITYSKDAIWQSQTAYLHLLSKIKLAIDNLEEVYITIQKRNAK